MIKDRDSPIKQPIDPNWLYIWLLYLSDYAKPLTWGQDLRVGPWFKYSWISSREKLNNGLKYGLIYV